MRNHPRRRHPLLLSLVLASFAAALGATRVPAADDPPAEVASDVEIPHPAYISLWLARDEAVHAELNLDARQRQAVLKAVGQVDYPLWLLRDVPVTRSLDKLDALREQLRTALAAVLSAEQAARFDQLVMHARGSKALIAPDVRERLELTDEQHEQFKQIVAAAKQGELDSKTVLAVLSPAQQTALAGLFGRRFDASQVTYVGCAAPELRSVDAWINSAPLTLEGLRGKVVVVHFWAFNCSNCINNLPHYQAWYERFPASEVTIIGIHTPETASERVVDNLRANVNERGIQYPVAVDGSAENWKAWANNMWPSVYLIDRQGNVRSWWYGELNWQGADGEQKMRKRIEELMAEK